MIIYQMSDNPYHFLENPYILTLMDGIKKNHPDFKWLYGFDKFWSEEVFCCDVVHVHWPDTMIQNRITPNFMKKFQAQLEALKKRDVKIVATCHNLEPHYCKNSSMRKCYSLVYSHADAFIHLGQYSLNILASKYPNAKHVIIPHHTYDAMYSRPDRLSSIKKLNLDSDKKYILCFGSFRNNEERKMVDSIADYFYPKGVEVLAPNYYNIPYYRRNKIVVLVQWIKCVAKRLSSSGIHIYGKYVPNEMIPYFYGASSLSLIQRKKVLNSGNLPLGFLMGNVVVGPNVGNVGELLNKYGNPVFDISNDNTIISAIEEGLKLSEEGLGNRNAIVAQNEFSTDIVSEKLYNFYTELLDSL